MKQKTTVDAEVKRLAALYKELPPKKFELAQGLILQAARLRVRLDNLWEEIEKDGDFEDFTQSEKTPSYERERPCARLFTATDKNYQSIIKQLDAMLPPDTKESFGDKLKALTDD